MGPGNPAENATSVPSGETETRNGFAPSVPGTGVDGVFTPDAVAGACYPEAIARTIDEE